jgi:phosphatidylglycerol:prolipoprotein diacylglycerol transferase
MIPFPNISPEIFTVNVAGIDFTLRWYALSYVAGFLIAIAVMRSFTSRGHLWHYNTGPIDRDQVDGLVTYLILGVILGGRIGYVLFYNLEYYVSNPGDIVRVWDGGMAFHGGFLGVVIATILYCRYNGIILWSCADLIALSAGPGIFLGRVANFINAELWGRPTDAPWGVVFPGARAQDCPGVVGECARHPSQLYEAGLEGLLLFTILIVLALIGALRRPGSSPAHSS